MKKILFLCLLLFAATAYSDDAKNEWHNTTLSEATIEKIQAAKFEYKKCVSDEMQKSAYQQQDSRNATEAIIKQCEPVLAKMREVYTDAKVPGSHSRSSFEANAPANHARRIAEHDVF